MDRANSRAFLVVVSLSIFGQISACMEADQSPDVNITPGPAVSDQGRGDVGTDDVVGVDSDTSPTPDTTQTTTTDTFVKPGLDTGSNVGGPGSDAGESDPDGGEPDPDVGEPDPDPPEPLDTDGDGLTDEDEKALGTDPEEPDTDSDGYTDSEEVLAGTDPNDAESVIYQGGWPFNPNKDELELTAWGGPPQTGKQIPNFKLVDQYGDTVSVYDYAGHGKLIMIDISTPICKPCTSMAKFLSDGDTGHLVYKVGPKKGEWLNFWKPQFEPIYEMVKNGDIYWITVLAWHPSTSPVYPVTPTHCKTWHQNYPNPKIAVLADTDSELVNYFDPGSAPAFFLLNENMEFMTYQKYTTTGGLGKLFSNPTN